MPPPRGRGGGGGAAGADLVQTSSTKQTMCALQRGMSRQNWGTAAAMGDALSRGLRQAAMTTDAGTQAAAPKLGGAANLRAAGTHDSEAEPQAGTLGCQQDPNAGGRGRGQLTVSGRVCEDWPSVWSVRLAECRKTKAVTVSSVLHGAQRLARFGTRL
eukprot:SAG22_NODE_1222_length_5126_cov_3.213248_2_plen_158_part_00